MTYKEIDTMVGLVGLPYAYYQFPKTGQQPPFICWYFEGIDDLYGDNINYQRIVNLTIEFYSDEKDFTNEAAIESQLTHSGLTYYKEESYIDTEKMHMTVYQMEVLINGKQS